MRNSPSGGLLIEPPLACPVAARRRNFRTCLCLCYEGGGRLGLWSIVGTSAYEF